MIYNQMILFLMMTLLSGFTESAYATSQDQLKKADVQLQRAIKEAEVSLGPHQPGSGWTKRHMQAVTDMLEGNEGPDFQKNDSALKEEEKGLLPLLNQIQKDLKSANSPHEIDQALDGTLFFIQQAVEQAKMSVAAKSIDETHSHARLAAGMLAAALGLGHTESPVTGNLEFVLRHIK
ncbi:MAG TPA: hypothetical protein VN944_06180 [Nitrospiria bacterium]|nr:hypothetical protein [Nitrospiria bacterium]